MQKMNRRILEPWAGLGGIVVLVTGASSGLGRELCLDLAKAGCLILAAARRLHRLKHLCEEISPRGIPVELDVAAGSSSIDRAVQSAWDAFGRIDVVINNAGITGTVRDLIELSEEEWEHVMRTNVRGSFLVAKAVCRRMRAAESGGSVINISSISGAQRGYVPGGVAYAASKAAVNTMTKAMAVELGPYNIRVNSINPGFLKSEITRALMEKHWFDGIMEKTVPLRSVGTADPLVTSLVRYLIHQDSQYVSGNHFIADAGATLPGLPIFSSL